MQINSINSNSSGLRFGRLNLYSGSKDVLKNVLKPNEIEDFRKLCEEQSRNFVDINLFSRNLRNRKLEAILSSELSGKTKTYSQRLFEPAMKFIRRCCHKAEEFKKTL